MAGSALTRRGLIAVCGVGALSCALDHPLLAQAAKPGRTRRGAPDAIDIHYHVETAAVERLPKTRANARGADAIPRWNADMALTQMDRQGIAASVVTTRVIGVKAPDSEADVRSFVRACNLDGAAIVRANPKRFRYFAYMPMPFVQATIEEIGYALDTLGADGVYFNTSYNGKWLGHPDFTPIMAELNRRNAIVYTHPSGATCCGGATVPNLTPQIIEYGTDTTRCIADLIFSGTADRFSNIRFIFSHAGGTAPFLFERLEREGRERKDLPGGAAAPFKRFFFDTAQSANPYALGTLARLVPSTQILYGSDYPWRDPLEQLHAIDAMKLGPSLTAAIRHGNAQRLIAALR